MIKFLLLYSTKLIWIILGLMMFILNLASKKSFSDRSKSSPFECGFEPKNSARLPFSLQFFLIAVIFIIFDVELTILLPMILALKTTNLLSFTFMALTFMLILLIGLYHEWKQGALDWAK
uniref:NADH-ubiquinone oxidoreductase chain 3 n=1 Tax=Aegorhinus superciliosus TaxID=1448030 RepID=A0A0K0K9H8_9CUCU|nr:NADH dehydrogenase subunit 3 [Aegorhinus superciliosus]AHG32667.1 NADH dehydrogenase subunit 3 [Aegorhinus superciliosus]